MKTLSATSATTSTSSPSLRPANRAVASVALSTRPRVFSMAVANDIAAAAFGSADTPRRAADSSLASMPCIVPIAVCADRQYSQPFCWATVIAMRSPIFPPRLLVASAPKRPFRAVSAAGDCAAVRNMLGVPPIALRVPSSCVATVPVAVVGSMG